MLPIEGGMVPPISLFVKIILSEKVKSEIKLEKAS